MYDPNGAFTGKVVDKDTRLGPDEYFLHAHMALCSADSRFLLQTRSRKKKYFPGVWDITGGGVQAGETARQAAARETKEELGLNVPDAQMRLGWKFSTHEPYRSHVEVWGAKFDIDLNSLTLDKEEVDEVRFAPMDEYRGRLLEQGRRVQDAASPLLRGTCGSVA